MIFYREVMLEDLNIKLIRNAIPKWIISTQQQKISQKSEKMIDDFNAVLSFEGSI